MSERRNNGVPFDVLSYPRRSVTETIVVDVTEEKMRRHMPRAHVQYMGRGALKNLHHETEGIYNTLTVVSDNEQLEEIVELGAGVIKVDNSDGLDTALDLLLAPQSQTDQTFYQKPLYTHLSYEEVAETLFRPNEVHVVGFVGRTGAGKSTSIRRLIDAAHSNGTHAGLFEIDAFFKRSRPERKAWLNEPGISDDERSDRQRIVTWWNLAKAARTLMQLREGNSVHLENLYDMQQGGEMVGVLDIDPGTSGYTVFVEGTALLLPEFHDVIDSFVYMNMHNHVRAQSLMERNLRDGYTPEESHARKALTDAAETNEHIAEHLRKERFNSGKLTVLDNTSRNSQLCLMPPYIPRQ